MSDPNFNAQERYLIAYYERGKPGQGMIVWAIHVAFAALFGYGLHLNDKALLFAAFGGVILWRIYESSYQPQFFRTTQSVLQKYAASVNAKKNET